MSDILLKKDYLDRVHDVLALELAKWEKSPGKHTSNIRLFFIGDTCLAERSMLYGFGGESQYSIFATTDSPIEDRHTFEITSENFNILYDKLKKENRWNEALLYTRHERDMLWLEDKGKTQSWGVPITGYFTPDKTEHRAYEENEKRQIIDIMRNGKRTVLHVTEDMKSAMDDVRKTMLKLSRVDCEREAEIVYVQDKKTAMWTDGHIAIITSHKENKEKDMFDGECFTLPAALTEAVDNGMQKDVEVLYDGKKYEFSTETCHKALYRMPDTQWYIRKLYDEDGRMNYISRLYLSYLKDDTAKSRVNTICVPKGSMGSMKKVLQDCKKTYDGSAALVKPVKFELCHAYAMLKGGKDKDIKESFPIEDISGITNLLCDGYITDPFDLRYILDIIKHYSGTPYKLTFDDCMLFGKSLDMNREYTKHIMLASLIDP